MIRVDVFLEKGERFKVLGTGERAQLATMTLPPGQSTVNEEGHRGSDQVVYVVEGRVELTVGDGEKAELRAGEAAIIPSDTPHTIKAIGRRPSTVLNVYGPPAYPPEHRRENYSDAPGEGVGAF